MKIINTDKNKETGRPEITIRFTSEEIEYIKESILLVIDRKLGDSDDPDRIGTMEELKRGLHEARNLTKSKG
jgi:hypothetical protein